MLTNSYHTDSVTDVFTKYIERTLNAISDVVDNFPEEYDDSDHADCLYNLIEFYIIDIEKKTEVI